MTGNEDCLTLNVWTPAASTAGPMPVMVFIHGGGNVQGSASETLTGGARTYDGQYLSEHGPAIVVTFEYRLGVLGFLAHPALSTESGHGSGNYGLMDQQAALAWVHDNIAAFGGDPSRVLVFGESAGAVDTCVLLTSPASHGLFTRALTESGPCTAAPLASAEANGTMRVGSTSCSGASDVLACLRAMSADQVVAAIPGTVNVSTGSPGTGFGPVVDGTVLPLDPTTALQMGMAVNVPFVTGSNANETSRSVMPIATAMAYNAAVLAWLGPTLAPPVEMHYPPMSFASPTAAFVEATTDGRFVCPTRRVARAAVAHAPVYRYFFTHALHGPMGQAYGAFHGLELTFVFHTLSSIPGFVPSATELALSDAMVGYWTRFAATGDPNGSGATVWPPYDASTDPYLQLDDAIQSGTGVRTGDCDFWQTLLGY